MKIEYDDEKQEVSIDGVRFDGRIWEDVKCDQCGGPIIFYEDHDADFCPACNVWKSNGLGELPAKPMPLTTYNLK